MCLLEKVGKVEGIVREMDGWMMMGKKRFERKTNGWINK